MKTPQSVLDIDLAAIPGKNYWQSGRSSCEEIIYFVLIDRFHDNHKRAPSGIPEKAKGYGTPDELHNRCGGTLKGIRNHLSYIKNLGCTAMWLSPVFENDPQSYHGYSIRNFLNIDPRLGTLADLQDLVTSAHEAGIKVFLDVVLNHSGDNWYYLGDRNHNYHKGTRYRFGAWRSKDFPVPVELRNPDYYQRKGAVVHWDQYPETIEGDFFSLKKFNHEESEDGLALQEILLKVYCYWIRATDCDGFRIDAAKHLGETASARFTSKVKEFAATLGKDSFFVFGEVAGDDHVIAKFLQPVVSEKQQNTYQGFDGALDFPLHFCLPKIIRGEVPVQILEKRYQSLRNNIPITSGGLPVMVNFLDNHDQIERPYKKRIAAQFAEEKQLIASLGILFCLPGIPCIYYGTEQAFKGEGNGDAFIREAMFNLKEAGQNALHHQHPVYQEIAKFAQIRKEVMELISGSLAFPEVSADGRVSGKADIPVCVFSRVQEGSAVYVVYNTSVNETLTVYVQIKESTKIFTFLYGREGTVCTETWAGDNPFTFIPLTLVPMEFIILK